MEVVVFGVQVPGGRHSGALEQAGYVRPSQGPGNKRGVPRDGGLKRDRSLAAGLGPGMRKKAPRWDPLAVIGPSMVDTGQPQSKTGEWTRVPCSMRAREPGGVYDKADMEA